MSNRQKKNCVESGKAGAEIEPRDSPGTAEAKMRAFWLLGLSTRSDPGLLQTAGRLGWPDRRRICWMPEFSARTRGRKHWGHDGLWWSEEGRPNAPAAATGSSGQEQGFPKLVDSPGAHSTGSQSVVDLSELQ